MQEIIKKALNKDTRAIAKLLSCVENSEAGSLEALRKIHSHISSAYYLGITGPPGVGKSTIVDKLIRTIRKENHTCAVLCVDPTSPFTGGAILGDRIRMQAHFADEGVFIRSMATRGNLGGLARKTNDCAKILDAVGYEYIIFETVGTGQVEIDIAQASDSTVVVLQPGGGDSVQVMKAGILEIADIFVINKCEREGAEQLFTELQMMIDLLPNKNIWIPKIILTSAILDKGIIELWENILKHKNYLQASNLFLEKRKERTRQELLNLITGNIMNLITQGLDSNKTKEIVDNIFHKRTDPYTEAEKLCKTKFLKFIK